MIRKSEQKTKWIRILSAIGGLLAIAFLSLLCFLPDDFESPAPAPAAARSALQQAPFSERAASPDRLLSSDLSLTEIPAASGSAGDQPAIRPERPSAPGERPSRGASVSGIVP